jgi:hypothetical protein
VVGKASAIGRQGDLLARDRHCRQFVISLLLSGSIKLAVGIASVEVMTKMVL